MCGRPACFNSYLLFGLLLTGVFAVGCKTPEERREAKLFTHFWLHLEIPDGYRSTNRVATVKIAGYDMRVTSSPFLTESDVAGASVVDEPGGGFGLRVEFSEHGRLVLSTVTTSERSRRMPIFADWGPKKSPDAKKRWLAAPIISRPAVEGFIVFTPDATREELDEIVRGLNNAAKENKKAWVF